jgi:hypothetical protein
LEKPGHMCREDSNQTGLMMKPNQKKVNLLRVKFIEITQNKRKILVKYKDKHCTIKKEIYDFAIEIFPTKKLFRNQQEELVDTFSKNRRN